MLEVLVVFVAEAVGGDVGASFRIANVLHLVRVFFEADFAEIPQGAQDSRHIEVPGFTKRLEVLKFGMTEMERESEAGRALSTVDI